MKRPLEQDYASLVAYTRALEQFCDALAQPEQEPVACIWEKNDGYKSLEWGGLDANEIQEIGLKSYTPLYTHLTQCTWVWLIRGVRVEGDTVVITVKSGNDAARKLCYALIGEMEKNT